MTKTISCAYAEPVLTSHSYSISTRRANMSVLHVLMLMSPVFALAYTCACVYAYAYAYAPVKIRLQPKWKILNTSGFWRKTLVDITASLINTIWSFEKWLWWKKKTFIEEKPFPGFKCLVDSIFKETHEWFFRAHGKYKFITVISDLFSILVSIIEPSHVLLRF